jgi:hypothetical protein
LRITLRLLVNYQENVMYRRMAPLFIPIGNVRHLYTVEVGKDAALRVRPSERKYEFAGACGIRTPRAAKARRAVAASATMGT